MSEKKAIKCTRKLNPHVLTEIKTGLNKIHVRLMHEASLLDIS